MTKQSSGGLNPAKPATLERHAKTVADALRAFLVQLQDDSGESENNTIECLKLSLKSLQTPQDAPFWFLPNATPATKLLREDQWWTVAQTLQKSYQANIQKVYGVNISMITYSTARKRLEIRFSLEI